MKYDIHNPLPGRRIIHDGDIQIVIEAGATKSNVEMSDGLAKEMQARKGDLEITPAGTGKPSAVAPPQPHIADEGIEAETDNEQPEEEEVEDQRPERGNRRSPGKRR